MNMVQTHLKNMPCVFANRLCRTGPGLSRSLSAVALAKEEAQKSDDGISVDWKKQLILITFFTISFSLHSMKLMKRGTTWFTRTFLLPSIHKAAQNGDLESVQNHIRIGTNLNQEDKDGCTALTWAAINGDLPMVKCLIKFGADVDLIDKYGQTLLHFATRQNSLPSLLSCEELVGAKLRQMTAEQKKIIYTFLNCLKFGAYKDCYSHWKNLFKEPLRVVMREQRKPKILKEVNELSHKEIRAHLRAKYFPEVEEKLK